MDAQRWQKAKDLFNDALELDPEQVESFLEQSCAGEVELRHEVEVLLAAYQKADGFMGTPAVEDAIQVVKDEQARMAAGSVIGHYRFIREIGHGGMGTVFLAERADEEYKKQVAIKLIRGGLSDEHLLQRFRDERQILANLDHANIARLIDGGATEDGAPYLVLDYVEGLPIDDYCDAHKLTTIERLKLFRVVCSAVQYAHQNLVVHRDLKPSNILVAEDGTPKLLDFGIAKLLHPDGAEPNDQTATVARIMTPQFASPEQVRGKTITTASDIYSLGVLLYRLLTGHHPYQFKSLLPAEIDKVICEKDPDKPSTAISQIEETPRTEGETTSRITIDTVSEMRSEAPDGLRRRLKGDIDNIVLMAMRKEPERRYSSVEQFSEDIGRHLEGLPVIATADSFGYRASKFIVRHKAGVAAGTLVVAALLIGLVGTAWEAKVAAAERDTARREKEIAQHEKEKAVQINAFLQDMLNSSNPTYRLPNSQTGHEITIKEALDEAARSVETEMADQPDIRAAVQLTIGASYEEMGRFDLAEPHLRAALETNQKLYGDESAQTMESYQALAGLLLKKGDSVQAEQLFLKVLPIYRKQKEAGTAVNAADFADALNDYALILRNKGRVQEAEPLLREGLEFSPQILLKQRFVVSTMRTNLALIRADQGDFDEAEKLHRATISESRAIPGRERIELAHALRGLGDVLIVKGQLNEAEAVLHEAEELYRKLVGDLFPNQAFTFHSEAYLLYLKGDYRQAEADVNKAIEISNQILHPSHPAFFFYRTTLGLIWTKTGRAREAEKSLRDTLKSRAETYGEHYYYTALTRAALGECLTTQTRFEEAAPLMIESYNDLKASQGEQNPRTVEGLHRLADFYDAWKKPDRSAQYRAMLNNSSR
jgi:serine/threonine-protein kinase